MIWKVKDNSGVTTAKHLTIQKTKRFLPRVGDLITVFPRKYVLRKHRNLKRQKYTGLVLLTTRPVERYAYKLWSPSNSIVLLDGRDRMVGTRIFSFTNDESQETIDSSYALRKLYGRVGGRYL